MFGVRNRPSAFNPPLIKYPVRWEIRTSNNKRILRVQLHSLKPLNNTEKGVNAGCSVELFGHIRFVGQGYVFYHVIVGSSEASSSNNVNPVLSTSIASHNYCRNIH